MLFSVCSQWKIPGRFLCFISGFNRKWALTRSVTEGYWKSFQNLKPQRRSWIYRHGSTSTVQPGCLYQMSSTMETALIPNKTTETHKHRLLVRIKRPVSTSVRTCWSDQKEAAAVKLHDRVNAALIFVCICGVYIMSQPVPRTYGKHN